MPAALGGGGSAVMRSYRSGVVRRKNLPSSMWAWTRGSASGLAAGLSCASALSFRTEAEVSTMSMCSSSRVSTSARLVVPSP